VGFSFVPRILLREMNGPPLTHESPEGETPPLVPQFPDAEGRKLLRVYIGLLALLGTGTLIGVASSLYLVNSAPLVLIGISPLTRHLVLVAPMVDPFAFALVAGIRIFAFSFTAYAVGGILGPKGLEWLDARAQRTARAVRWMERIFARGAHLAVFLFPFGSMCAIAGVSRMAKEVFIPVVIAGIGFRLGLIGVLGSWLQEPIEWMLAWIEVYRLPGTVALIAAIAIYQLARRMRARSTQTSVPR
jgi:hypothetical protein